MEQFDTVAQLGLTPQGVVKRWVMELELADKAEEKWRKKAEKTLKRYRGEDKTYSNDGKRTGSAFNILWANVETLKPALYSSVPRPDVRRRFRDSDPLGKAVADVAERCLTYTLDSYDFDETMRLAVMDLLLPGRAVDWVRYDSDVTIDEMGQQVMAYEAALCEHVQWNDFRRGPGKEWAEVMWVARRHKFSRDMLVEKFGEEIGSAVPLNVDCLSDDRLKKERDESDQSLFKHAEVWEIWDRETRFVLFICCDYKDQPLKAEPDPLGLKGFFPTPRPMYGVQSPDSLEPIPEYDLYEDQAVELDRITRRINKIVSAIKARGVYDSTLGEVSRLFDGDDNELIPAENAQALYAMGGLDKAIWMMPIEALANVLTVLYQQREQLKQVIYELTGISDIVRGQSRASETATAQTIKNQWGALRLQDRQKEIQRYARDLIRMKAEIICEHFSPETIIQMSGAKYPTAEEKMQIQAKISLGQNAAMMGMPAEQPTPEELDALEQPTWDEIIITMRDQLMRDYRVDIETDSTIAGNDIEEQRNVTELLTGVVSFLQGVAPLVLQGVLPADAAKTLLMAAVRRFSLGSEVEDALDQIGQQPQMSGLMNQAAGAMAVIPQGMSQMMPQAAPIG